MLSLFVQNSVSLLKFDYSTYGFNAGEIHGCLSSPGSETGAGESDCWYCLAGLQEPLQLPGAVKASPQRTAFYT